MTAVSKYRTLALQATRHTLRRERFLLTVLLRYLLSLRRVWVFLGHAKHLEWNAFHSSKHCSLVTQTRQDDRETQSQQQRTRKNRVHSSWVSISCYSKIGQFEGQAGKLRHDAQRDREAREVLRWVRTTTPPLRLILRVCHTHLGV